MYPIIIETITCFYFTQFQNGLLVFTFPEYKKYKNPVIA